MNRSRFLSRLSAYSLRTLNEGGTLLESLALPPAYRLPLWIAGNSVSFYEDISIIWNVVRTPAKKMNCGMVVGAGYPACVEYRWSPGPSSPPVRLPAAPYVQNVLDWTLSTINDPSIFPFDDDLLDADEEELCLRVWCTEGFAKLLSTMFRRMFRCYAIVYSSLYELLQTYGLAAHFNSSFKRFLYFCLEFSLVEDREFKVIGELVNKFKGQYKVAKIDYEAKQSRIKLG